MNYKIQIKKQALKTLQRLPKNIVHRINEIIQELKINPRPFGVKKLIDEENLYRIRFGDYRIIYSIEDDVLTIEIIKIGHRKEVY